MGSFFTNIQVYTGNNHAITPADVNDALKSWASGKQYIEAPKGRPAERTLALAISKNGKWITVYDEESEEQDDAVMDELLSVLSQSLHTAAIGVTVQDSDLLGMRMYENGRMIDFFSNEYYYWDREPTPDEKKGYDGNPEKWKPLLDDHPPEALRKAWDTEETFVEDRLYRAAELLGMEHKHCMTGYNYNHKARYLTKLRLNPAKKREPAYAIIKDGPPKFKIGTLFDAISSRVSIPYDDACTYTFFLWNEGGPAKGIYLLVVGEAIDKGILEVLRIACSNDNRPEGQCEAILEKRYDEQSKQNYYAGVCAEFEIPEGILRRRTGKLKDREGIKPVSNVVNVNITMKRLKAEDSKLFIAFVPFGTAQEDREFYTFQVEKDTPSPVERERERMQKLMENW